MSFNYIKGYFLLALPAWERKVSKELKETILNIWENVKDESQDGTLNIPYKEKYNELLKNFSFEELSTVSRIIFFLDTLETCSLSCRASFSL